MRNTKKLSFPPPSSLNTFMLASLAPEITKRRAIHKKLRKDFGSAFKVNAEMPNKIPSIFHSFRLSLKNISDNRMGIIIAMRIDPTERESPLATMHF